MKHSERYASTSALVCIAAAATRFTSWAGSATAAITLALFALGAGLLRTAYVWKRLERNDDQT